MRCRLLIPSAILLTSPVLFAKTASEVYEQAAQSTVVVLNIDSGGQPKSMGSGVVLPDGDVVTNCHVVKQAGGLKVRIGQAEYPAHPRHTDWERDVCALSVTGISAPAVGIGSTKMLKVGARVYAIGAPRGLELTLSEGIVSSLREVEGGRYIQTTAPISPGSSGGGLFDEEGRLIGLTTFYLKDGQQLNFAVPVEWIAELPQRHREQASAGEAEIDWLNRAVSLEQNKDWPALLEHGLHWTQARSTSAPAWFCLGVAYDKSGQIAQAIDAYRQALRIDPEHAGAWSNLGNAYADSGQSAKAIDAYRQALRIDPEHARAWYNLAVAYADPGQTAQAIDAYRQALRINSEYAKAWNNLGNAYHRSGQIVQAIDAYRQALRINPEDTGAWYNLGNTYHASGQTAQAIDAYRQALRINPEFAEAWYNLGATYKFAGQNDRALEVYRQLKTLSPSQADKFFAEIVLP